MGVTLAEERQPRASRWIPAACWQRRCRLLGWYDVPSMSWWVQHGENPEAVIQLSDRLPLDAMNLDLRTWAERVRAYEDGQSAPNIDNAADLP